MTWIGVAWRLGLLAAVAAGALWFASVMYDRGYAHATAEHERAAATARESDRLADRARHATQVVATTRIDHEHHKALRAAQARAAAADADARGLRDTLAAITADRAASGAGAAGCADVARQRDGLAGLLAEATELVAAGQEAGGRLAAAHTGLQRYVAEVCRVPVSQ